MAATLSEKMYYKIGEVAEAAGVKTSVLRFWETEFSFLKPVKSTSGQRLYSRNEVDLVLQVKHLLYEQKFTIEGVKKRFNIRGKMINQEDLLSEVPTPDYTNMLIALRNELKVIRDLL